jgi:small subunit ribosomal protein S17
MPEERIRRGGVRKERRGKVCSISGNKSIVVLVERRVQHPVYGKTLKKLRKFHVHDEKCEAKIGDTVRIVETRPLSKMKRWRVVEVVA